MAQQLSALPGFKPLYQQVKDLLIERLIGGYWRPGDLLPSEMQLAEQLGVSQGTVRKALDEMTAGNLLVRRQGLREAQRAAREPAVLGVLELARTGAHPEPPVGLTWNSTGSGCR